MHSNCYAVLEKNGRESLTFSPLSLVEFVIFATNSGKDLLKVENLKNDYLGHALKNLPSLFS